MSRAGRLVLVLSALAACASEDTRGEDPPVRSVEQQKHIPFASGADLDVLFVVDTSGSMAEEQASLAVNYERFGWVFESFAASRLCPPNFHIGVVSGDLGTGPYPISGCSPDGDDAALQSAARVPGCLPPTGSFLQDEIDADGQHLKNYEGSLSEALPCIAQLGAGGCGFQQPLEAMRRALDGNDGFRRDYAYLLVVLISDEDDCSAADVALFDPAEDVLGPLTKHRCFEAGVECSPDDPRTPGIKSGCASREVSRYVEPVRSYVDYLDGLPGPGVLVATIAGNTEPVEVVDHGDGSFGLAPSCASATASASPGIRLAELAAQFPQRNTVTSICNEDLSPSIGDFFTGIVDYGTPCLEGEIVDTDEAQPGLQPECAVTEVRRGPDMPETTTVLPRCDDTDDPEASTNFPCYVMPEDPLGCPDTPTSLSFERYPQCALGAGHIEIRCLAQ